VKCSRKEQRRAQQELAEALRQLRSNAEIQRFWQTSGGLVEQQISPFNNINSSGGVRDCVAHSCADGDDAGAHARECVEPCDPFCTGAIRKPDTYNGSISLNEFLIQFELIA